MSLMFASERPTRRKFFVRLGVFGFVVLVTLGVFARNGWFPSTDAMTGKRTGWFGRAVPKNAASSWNPLAAVLPSPTPQLSKELIYAGSRLLAVEDVNANAAPPADLAVWRPSSGYWYVLGGPGSTQTFYQYGASTDTPVEGDYDGDGKTDFAVVRPNTSDTFDWYITYSAGGTNGFTFGNDTDTPVVADYDGDGKSDPAVYRPSTGYWYWLKSGSAYASASQQYGTSGDVTAPADYDGDGKADFSVFRGSNTTFYTLRSSDSTTQYTTFGNSSDTPVSADYDGDGKANYALRHNADWLIRNAALTSTSTTTPSGDQSTDLPVQNDYDGDGKVDIAVWRPIDSPSGTLGDWFIRQSTLLGQSGELRQVHWGTQYDIPVPAYYRR